MSTDPQTSRVRRLADLETGDLVQVRSDVNGSTSGEGAPRLRPGEVLQCIDRSESGTLVARPDGTRLQVGHVRGMAIEVQLFWDPIRAWYRDDAQDQVS